MNQILTNFTASVKSVFLLLVLCLLFSFQQGNAQHCHPGFHFSIDENIVVFDDLSTADGNITAYSWDFGDGQTSTEQNPTHTYTSPGTYNVCLTITALNPDCTETFCHHLVVTEVPAGVCHASFSASQPDLAQTTIDFTDQSTSDGIIGAWDWDFGDGNTSNDQNPSHTYAVPGTYLVCLTITDDDGGCTSHVCHHVVVEHPPAGVCQAEFVNHQTDPAQLTIDFTDQSTSDGTIGTWTWDFGDGSTSNDQNPSHTYAAPGTYLVCLTITDDDGDCTSHICHHVVVEHPPVNECHAAFIIHPDSSGLGVQFTNTSSGTTNTTTYSWEFGDGTTSAEENPHHTYAHSGHYTVCLFIADTVTGCSSHFCHHINVHHASVHHHHHHHFSQGEAVNGMQGESSEERNGSSSDQMIIYPNPVVGAIKVVYQIPVDSKVKFELYNMTGARVLALAESTHPAGEGIEIIPVGDFLPGVYVLKMTIDGMPQVRKIMVQ